MAKPFLLFVAGDVSSPGFQRGRNAAEAFSRAKDTCEVEVRPLLPFDAAIMHRNLRPVDSGVIAVLDPRGSARNQKLIEKLGDKAQPLAAGAAGYFGDEVHFADSAVAVSLAGLIELGSQLEINAKEHRPDQLLQAVGRAELRKVMEASGDPHVVMKLDFGTGEAGEIHLQLFQKRCPKTTKHFLSLCNADNAVVRRVSPGGFSQFEALAGVEDGIQDENFAVAHDAPGILGMLNSWSKDRPNEVTPHTGTQQFYVTHREAPAFDRRFVAFGRVVDGFNILDKLQRLDLTPGQAPRKAVQVTLSALKLDK